MRVAVSMTAERGRSAVRVPWSTRREAIYAQGRGPVVDALVALSARLEAQDAQLAALAERVEELEQRLKRDSRNSSLPPSHDPPWLGKRGRSRGTGRARTETRLVGTGGTSRGVCKQGTLVELLA
jgi:Family of unknown function (DUF6444)